MFGHTQCSREGLKEEVKEGEIIGKEWKFGIYDYDDAKIALCSTK